MGFYGVVLGPHRNTCSRDNIKALAGLYQSFTLHAPRLYRSTAQITNLGFRCGNEFRGSAQAFLRGALQEA